MRGAGKAALGRSPISLVRDAAFFASTAARHHGPRENAGFTRWGVARGVPNLIT
jgi:hypothetical protein